MAIKTLQLDLGPSVRATGWYRDQTTGQYYYYDARARQWYVYSAGWLYPMGIVLDPNPPYVVDIAPGDTLRVTISYQYAGPAVTVTERAAIGTYGAAGFDEKSGAWAEQTHDWPTTPTPTERTTTLDITVPDDIAVSNDDLYARASTPEVEAFHGYENCLNVVGIEPDISELSIESYSKV